MHYYYNIAFNGNPLRVLLYSNRVTLLQMDHNGRRTMHLQNQQREYHPEISHPALPYLQCFALRICCEMQRNIRKVTSKFAKIAKLPTVFTHYIFTCLCANAMELFCINLIAIKFIIPDCLIVTPNQ